MKGKSHPTMSSNEIERQGCSFSIHYSPFTGGFGFTLLEVMISLAIIGGLLITVIYTLNYHLGIADRHVIVTEAMGLAKAKMAEMEKGPRETKGSFPEPYSTFSYETSVKDSTLIPGVSGIKLSEIKVVVRNGREEASLSELIQKSGALK